MKTCFLNVNLIDGTGEALNEKSYVLVDNGVIVDITKESVNLSMDDYKKVDLQGKYMMPGLIDCHVHMFLQGTPDTVAYFKNSNNVDYIVNAVRNIEQTIKGGVTFIRDVGGINHFDIQLKRHIANNNNIVAPEMLCAGKLITMTGGHGHFIGREADGPNEVRKAVREQLKAGADVIKLVSSGGVMTPGVDVNSYQFNIDELKAAVEEGHKAGRKLCTHCHSNQGIKNSIIAGIDSIEHATLLDDEAIEMLVEKGTFIVPTLSAVNNIVENGEKAGIPSYAVEKSIKIRDRHFNGFKRAYDAGVNIAMGTDAGTPCNIHGKNHQELVLMVKAGMSTTDAIITSTKKSAELLGISDKYGTLEIGKVADFLVLNNNPIEDISNINTIESVYKKGVKVTG